MTTRLRYSGNPKVHEIDDPMNLWVLLERYVEWIEVRGATPDALKSRRAGLNAFIHWCEDRGIDRPDQVTKPVMEQYLRTLFHYRKKDGMPLASRTQLSLLTVPKSFFRWLSRENLILYNPAADLELPKIPDTLPTNIFTPEQAETVLSLPDLKTAVGLRDRVILEVLYSSALRRMEVSNLRLRDVDVRRQVVVVHQGKNRQDRVVPLGERASAWVAKYLSDGRPHLAVRTQEDRLFLNTLGKPVPPDAMSGIVRHYIVLAGLAEQPGSCHRFRHTAATLMLEGGADTRMIQRYLGHKTLESTQIYTRVSVGTLQRVHAATHPGARLKRKTPADPNPPDSGDDPAE